MRRPTALTIAGSDSGGGAGIQADLKTFEAHGVFGMSALTAVTAQNTIGVQAVFTLPPDLVARQIDSVLSDIGADAVKIGMLANAEIIAVVAARLAEHAATTLVVDPVMVAKGGEPLLAADAREALIRLLLPMALVVTPNLHEAGALVGSSVRMPEEMRDAARAIHAMGPRYVLVKGGHLAEADPESDQSIDLLFDGSDFLALASTRFATRHTHGTGCTFASAIAANLALGHNVPEAAAAAKRYVTGAIEAGMAMGIGHGHGPVDHFWQVRGALPGS